MRLTLRSALPASFALAILVLAAPAHGDHRRVVTVDLEDVEVAATGYGLAIESLYDLSEPVPLDGVSTIVIDGMLVEFERDVPDGVGTDAFGFVLKIYGSDGEVVQSESPRVFQSTRRGPFSAVLRFRTPFLFEAGVDPGYTGTATSVGISLEIASVQTGGVNPRWRIDGFHGGAIKLHFVYGPESFFDIPDTHVLRGLPVRAISTGPGTVSEWESYTFSRPVSTENLGLVWQDIFGLSGGDETGIMTESQLIFDDDTVLSLDDSHSPSTGQPVFGMGTTHHTLRLAKADSVALEGRTIVGWRWRAHNLGAEPLTLRVRPEGTRFGFFYDDTEAPVEFLRGDCNNDSEVNLSDAVCIFSWLFRGGSEPACVAAANIDGLDDVNLTDPIHLLAHLFRGGPPLPAPFPACGTSDRTADGDLGCLTASCP